MPVHSAGGLRQTERHSSTVSGNEKDTLRDFNFSDSFMLLHNGVFSSAQPRLKLWDPFIMLLGHFWVNELNQPRVFHVCFCYGAAHVWSYLGKCLSVNNVNNPWGGAKQAVTCRVLLTSIGVVAKWRHFSIPSSCYCYLPTGIDRDMTRRNPSAFDDHVTVLIHTTMPSLTWIICYRLEESNRQRALRTGCFNAAQKPEPRVGSKKPKTLDNFHLKSCIKVGTEVIDIPR